MKVVGFNDIQQGRHLRIPVTTVKQPFHKLGRIALTTLLTRLKGKKIDRLTVISPELVRRFSCGCVNPLITQADVEPKQYTVKPDPDHEVLAEARIITALSKVLKSCTLWHAICPGWRLKAAFQCP